MKYNLNWLRSALFVNNREKEEIKIKKINISAHCFPNYA